MITNGPGVKAEKFFDDISDHCLIVSEIKSNNKLAEEKWKIEIMNWRKFDGMILNNNVEHNLMKDHSIYDIKRPSKVDYSIQASIMDAFEKIVPTKTVTLQSG